MSNKATDQSTANPDHVAFAKRLNFACDMHRECPPLHYGRLTWLSRNTKMSSEAVRKWLGAIAKPRPAAMRRLALALGVDELELSTGKKAGAAADVGKKAQQARNAIADGMVNVFAGFVQICGGHPAFPQAGKENPNVDLYAIIAGTQYSIQVVSGFHTDGLAGGKQQWAAVVPNKRDGLVIVLGVKFSASHFGFLVLEDELIQSVGTSQGDMVELAITQEGSVTSSLLVGNKRVACLKDLDGTF